ncbi:MAG: hypothetical protein ACI4Q6_05310 [Huintestinicola sp.]
MEINKVSEEKALFIADDKKSEGNSKSMGKSLKTIAVIYGVLLLICIFMLIKSGTAAIPSLVIVLLAFAITMSDNLSRAKKHSAATFNAFCFYNDRYVNFDRLSQTSIPYELVIKAAETDDMIKIWFEARKCHVILKSTLTLGTAEELSSFLAARIPKYIKLTKGKKI